MPQPLPDFDTTLGLIAERAKVLEGQNRPAVFDVNISRRNSAGVPMMLASFSGATLAHIVNPERWLPQLVGGGEYIMNVRHPDLPDRIGGPLGVNFDKNAMEPKTIDPRIARAPNWQGPTLHSGAFPEPVAVPPNGFAGASVLQWPQNGQQPQAPVTTGYGFPTPTQTPDRERELAQQLADLKAHNARIEAESKARAELEAERRANDARLREVEQKADRERRESEARMQQQIAELRAATAAAPKVDPTAGWQQLISVFMPIVQQMLTGQHEMRMLTLKMSEEQNRRSIEASEKQHQAQMEMIRAITAQKPGMSEEMRLLLDTLTKERGGSGAEAMGAFMTKQLEAMGIMSRMSMDLVSAASEINLGESEHPMVGAIREAAMAVKTMMSGAQAAGQKMIPQKKLQPGQQQLTPQQVAQIRAQQAAQQRAQQQAAAQAGRTTPQKPGPQVVSVPNPAPAAPAPQTAPAPVIQFTPPQSVDLPLVPGTNMTHFEVLRAGVMELKPPAEVIEYFVELKNKDEPSLKAALGAHGGSPVELFKNALGMRFIGANPDYFTELYETLDARGIDEGWWADDGGGEEEGDADDAPEPENEPEAAAVEVQVPLDTVPAVPVPESAAIADPAPKA